MHQNSRLLFARDAVPYVGPGRRVLEIGPDGFPSTYRGLVGHHDLAWDTLDILDDSRLTYSATDPYMFPIPDDSYDVVVSGQVIEHVRKVWVWIVELARVCCPGGHVITVNPVSWPYHEAPIDCWRIHAEGMRTLYAEAGLEVVSCSTESLELPGYASDIPGMSLESRGWARPRRAVYRLFGKLGMRVERAYDTITIGRKPGG